MQQTSLLKILGYAGLSVFLGLCAGTFVAMANGFIADYFTSEHYTTAQQSHDFALGVTLGYAVMFAVVTFGLMILAYKKIMPMYFPVVAGIAAVIALWWRGLSSIGNLDCGNNCVNTIPPLAAQDLATHNVTIALYSILAVMLLFHVAVKFLRNNP